MSVWRPARARLFVRDYYVVVVSDGTAAYVHADHDMTLKDIDRFFGEIASIDELTALWPARNTTDRSQ
jgi:nicotinamidase-related amidase